MKKAKKAKKTKKTISLILAFAMMFTAALGCATVCVSAAEGQADARETEGPKLIDYSLQVDNTDPKTEAGSQITVNLVFDKEMGSTNWTKSAFDILINNRSLKDMGFEIKSVTPSGNNLVLVLQGIDNGEKSWAYVLSGKFDLSLKSNYYEDIVDKDGIGVSEWTDIHTYVQTGLAFEKSSAVEGDDDTKASVTFRLTGDAKLRGASPVQILVGGQSIVCTEVIPGGGEEGSDLTLGGNCNESRGTVNVHTHMYLMGNNTMWAKQLAGNFYSRDYTMTAEGDTVTITAKENGMNTALAQDTSVRMFAYTEGDTVVQPVLFREELAAARERAAEIADGNTVAPDRKDALNNAVKAADAVDPESVSSAVQWQKIRAGLQAAVDAAQDNAILSDSATRNNGKVNLKIEGGSDWYENAEIRIDGEKLSADQFEFTEGDLCIESTAFLNPSRTKEYDIQIVSEGYAVVDRTVTITFKGAQSLQLRILDAKGNVKASKTYTIDQIKQHPDVKTNQMYNTFCSMVGLRTFKGDGVYVEDLIDDLAAESGVTFRPDTTTFKLRTNDQITGTENDSTSEPAYWWGSTTSYQNLMQDRYWFPMLFEDGSDLKNTVTANWNNGINDEVKKALGENAREENIVKPMIAYQYVESIYRQDQNSIADTEYDEALCADENFRFLLGIKMDYDEQGNITAASNETTTWMASYQAFGIDLVDESSSSSNGSGGSGGSSSAAASYTVTFDANGGSSVAKQTVAAGKKAAKPTDPMKEGYEFAGWYANSGLTTAYDFEKTVTKSLTLYAKWTEKQAGAQPDPGANPAVPVKFADVASGSWYEEAVNYLADKGIVNGKTATTFEPNAQITRAEFVKILAGAAEADVSGLSTAKFSDVDSGSWYAPCIAWGVENGIINGVSDTQFQPNGCITRQDMAAMIKRYTDSAGFSLPENTAAVTFADDASIASYAKEAVSGMQKAGMINGKGENTFAPKDNATRAEASKILMILMEQMAK